MYQSLFTKQNQNQQNQVGLRLVDWLEEVYKESMPWVLSAIGNVLIGPPQAPKRILTFSQPGYCSIKIENLCLARCKVTDKSLQ